VPLFVELCAGTAALSLRLAHPKARPPVSRMGAKTGYADVILRCLGLYPGQGAEHYLWCEPEAGVRLLLHAYRDRALATAAADIIRSWKEEEPRALWERLRAEGPAVCPPVDPREVARWLTVSAWSHASNAWGHGAGVVASGQPNRRPGCDALSRSIHSGLLSTIAEDAREVDPREVARWIQRAVWSYEQGNVRTGFVGPGDRRQDTTATATATATARISLDLPATIAEDAREVDPPQLPPGVVVYIDPPYQGTTGYAHLFPRSEWLPVVRRWRDAGALVVVSEAEAIPELMSEGWHAVRIDGERRGQKRTFSKQQAEWLTMSESPKWRPSVQGQLFGGSR